MTAQLELDAAKGRDAGMSKAESDAIVERVAESAGDVFLGKAKAFIVNFLETHESATAEEMTDAAREAGIHPPGDDRQFGPAYRQLSREHRIEICGTAIRRKGHCCSGGNIWKLTAA